MAITAPVPRPPHRFWRCCDRWMTLSRHPGPCPDLAPLWSEAIRVAIRLFARRARRRVTADARPDLGPRSLDPDRTFWCAFAECIWSQASPVDFCNCLRRTGTEPGALTILAGTSAVTPFLFSTCHALSLAGAVTGGEPHTVRSFRPRCRFFLAFTRFSRPRYRLERATSASCPDGVAVAIDVHGSEDQEKDAYLP